MYGRPDEADEADEADDEYEPLEPEPEVEAPAPPVEVEEPAPKVSVTINGHGIDLRVDPFSRLDRDVAKAIAEKLAETLSRYAAPALVPMVMEEMADMLQAEDEDACPPPPERP